MIQSNKRGVLHARVFGGPADLSGGRFFLGPAELLQSLTGIDKRIWTVVIIAYYFLATIMPVDKIIGRIYPLFGADVLKVSQKETFKRLAIAVPLFLVGVLISFSDFGMIWRYFGWANQTLAVFVLWTAAVYLADLRKFHWVATIPAIFMTAVVTTFIANSTIGFKLPMPLATSIGIGAAVAACAAFFGKVRRIPPASEAAITEKPI